jgi:hypothetical protein
VLGAWDDTSRLDEALDELATFVGAARVTWVATRRRGRAAS